MINRRNSIKCLIYNVIIDLKDEIYYYDAEECKKIKLVIEIKEMISVKMLGCHDDDDDMIIQFIHVDNEILLIN